MLIDRQQYFDEQESVEDASGGGAEPEHVQQASAYFDQLDEQEDNQKPDTEEKTPPEPADESGEPEHGSVNEPVAEEPAEPEGGSVEPEVDPAILELAAQHGIPADQAREYPSVEALQTALDFYYRQMSQTGRQITGSDQPEQDQPQQPGEPGVQEKPASQPEQKPLPQFSDYITKLEKELGYDADLIEPLKMLQAGYVQSMQRNTHLQEQVEQLAQYLVGQREMEEAQSQQREANEFMRHVDGLGRSDLFGSGGKRTEEQNKNLQKLGEELTAIRTGLWQTGRDSGLTEALVQKALAFTFPDALKKEVRNEIHDKVKKQSERRMGSGKQVESKELPWNGDPTEDPVFQKFWQDRVVNA